MSEVFICDAIRTPIGRYAGALSSVRADDLAALPLKGLMERNPQVDWSMVDDVILGCANQSGEDNRNVARMSSLLAGLPLEVAGVTVNRLCGSGLNAVGDATRSIKAGEAELIIAGGVESMSRAPFVMGKATSPCDRTQELFDTTMGWRFVNKKLDETYGTETMPTTLEKLGQLRPLFGQGSITAGNASGINDGAAMLLLASEAAAKQYGLEPKARILGMAVAGVPPRIMGIGPAPASKKLLDRLGLSIDHMDIIELNEAFAAQALACTRHLGLADRDPRINPQGGAIALGHPLGMSGARLVTTAVRQLHRTGGKYALCSMCIGVGQGIAMVVERI